MAMGANRLLLSGRGNRLGKIRQKLRTFDTGEKDWGNLYSKLGGMNITR